MRRRTLARSAVHSLLDSQPWTLYDNDPGAGNGGGGGNPVGPNGFPENTPVAEMSHEHQAAYWRHHSRRWETVAKAAPTPEEVTQLRADSAELATRKTAELSETQRLQKEKDDAEAAATRARADAEAATRRVLLLEVASAKGLTSEQAGRLQGGTREELEADADALRAAFGGGSGAGGTTPPPSGGNRGGDVGGAGTLQAGADLYRQRNQRS
ncbi:hypothetical protein ACFVHB_20005 [Kitasatospora sp. NPDC127111]|uniref:hypothetical protein n=1 Tax=Kitasatospora sp. NPDC127111 TaxID=3345363 RepID=UPI0036301F82